MRLSSGEIQALLDSEEFSQLDSYFGQKEGNTFTPHDQSAWVEAKAALGASPEAFALYEKFGLSNPLLLGKIHYMLGNFDEALPFAEQAGDPYLYANIFLAKSKPRDAIAALKKAPLEAKWYYFMGRCYGHLFDYQKAIALLKKAEDLYLSKGDRIRATVALANRATYLDAQGETKRARSLFSEACRHLKEERFKKLPTLKSRVLINAGFFYFSAGDLYKGLRLLLKADHLLLGLPQSNDFFRVRILLANALKDLGHYRRSIQLLEPLRPQKKHQILDRARCLMSCNLELGDYDGARRWYLAAQDTLEQDDWLGFCLFSSDEAELLYKEGKIQEAKKRMEEAQACARSHKNETVFNYSRHRQAWFEKNLKSVEASLKFHVSKGLLLEASQDRITSAWIHLLRHDENRAKAELARLSANAGFPVQQAWKAILQAVIAKRKNRTAEGLEYLQKAAELASSRDMILPRVLVFYLQMLWSTEPAETLKSGEQYLRYRTTLHPHHLGELERIILELQLLDSTSYVVVSADKRENIDHYGLAQICSSRQNFVLDLVHKTMFENGKERTRFPASRTALNLLSLLAERRPNFVSKEEIANKVFGRSQYHPLHDDNRIYVALNRLRKSLGKRKIIEAGADGYRIVPVSSVWLVLSRSTR